MNPRVRPSRQYALPALAAAAVLSLAACSASAPGTADAAGASPASGGFPVTLDNCARPRLAVVTPVPLTLNSAVAPCRFAPRMATS